MTIPNTRIHFQSGTHLDIEVSVKTLEAWMSGQLNEGWLNVVQGDSDIYIHRHSVAYIARDHR
jgi:hypothetical protein